MWCSWVLLVFLLILLFIFSFVLVYDFWFMFMIAWWWEPLDDDILFITMRPLELEFLKDQVLVLAFLFLENVVFWRLMMLFRENDFWEILWKVFWWKGMTLNMLRNVFCHFLDTGNRLLTSVIDYTCVFLHSEITFLALVIDYQTCVIDYQRPFSHIVKFWACVIDYHFV